MKFEVEVPSEVEVEIDGKVVKVRGPRGELTRDFSSPLFDRKVEIRKEDSKVVVEAKIERKKILAYAGTVRALIRNMILGVTKGFRYVMRIHFVHFPMFVSAKKEGNVTIVEIKNYLGRKTSIVVKVEDVDIEVKENELIIRGIDKEKVGLAASKIEQATRPFREHDRRVFQDGIYLIERGFDSD